MNGASAGRVCVLVLGMHRSGTSALSRTLNLLGCDLPKILVSAAASNEQGHWESLRVCHLNDALLDSAGTNWHDFEAVNPDWFRSPKAGEYRQRAIETLKEEFGPSWFFVLKDPRINRIAGWWAETIEAAGVRPAILTTLRHPLEVADSLKKRDGFDTARGVLLWLRNTLDAEAQTRGRVRAFLSYDALLSDWKAALDRASATLGVAWPKRQSAATPAIDEFLSDAHRHHRRADAANAWAMDVYAVMSRWAEAGVETAADYETLDRIHARLDEAGHAFARLVASQWELQGRTTKLEKSLGGAEKKAADAEARLADAEKRLQQSSAETGELKARLAMTESALKQRALEAEDFAREVAALGARLKEALAEAARVSPLEAALAELNQELETARAAAQQEAARLQAEIRAAKSANEAAVGARFKEIAILTKILKDKDVENANLRDALDERDARADEGKRAEIERIEQALIALATAPYFPALRGRQLRRRAELLKATGLFDPEWYRTRYSDIAETGIDPALHFLQFGLNEGRHPNLEIARARGER